MTISAADTLWLLTASAVVLLMTSGLALFLPVENAVRVRTGEHGMDAI